MAEVVPADLPVIVRQAVWKRLRLREQQQARVLVGVAGEQHDLGRLEVLDAVGDVVHAGHAALVVDVDRWSRARACTTLRLAGRLRARNGRDVRAVLRIHMAAAAVAEAVVHARRAVLIGP